MTGVLAWKVYREQRVVWLAIAAVALGVLVLVQTVLGLHGEERVVIGLFFGAIAHIFGLVVGALLLAGEREAGTETFLQTLPAKRLAIWRAKGAAGGVLVLTQVLFLWLVLLATVGAYRQVGPAVLLFGALACVALLGFALGLFFSGWTRTPLGAILTALLAQAVVWPLLFGTFGFALWLLELRMLWGPPPSSPSGNYFQVIILGFILLLTMGLLVASGVGHARLDWVHRREAGRSRFETQASGGWLSRLAVLRWLVWRQSRWLYVGLAVAALGAGLFLPLWSLAWPLLTLLLGVTAGIAVFAGEQGEQTGRFLSEQRLSPGLVWAGKVGLHLAVAIGIAFLLLLPAAIRVRIGMERVYGSSPGPLSPPPGDFMLLVPYLQLGPYLTLWLGYGFSVGCLCGLLVPKPVVSGFIACGASLLLATLWAPSLVVGGLHAWQIWGTPLLLLLTVRLLLWPWATGRLGSRRAVIYLTGGLTLAGMWLAGALAYRAVEVPLVKDDLDLAGFERTVTAEWKNEASQLLRAALGQMPNLNTEIKPPREGEPDGKLPGLPGAPTIGGQMAEVIRQGWPAKEPELGAWLDKEFRQPWASKLAEAARLPLGVVEDVPGLTFPLPRPAVIYHATEAAELLVARGLQLQARGDPAGFVDNLAIGLALVRQLYHQEPTFFVMHAESAERMLLQGVERWLERLGKRPDLLRRVLALLVEYDQGCAREASDHLRANYLILMNAVTQPEAWLHPFVGWGGADSNPLVPLVALAWRTPWEQARLKRLVAQAVSQRDGSSLPPLLVFTYHNLFSPQSSYLRYNEKRETRLLAHELMVALRLLQAETGKPARTLQELTPRILASVPEDPATGKPFGYRLSDGEELPPDAQSGAIPRKVSPGQGILTSKEETFVVPLPRQGSESLRADGFIVSRWRARNDKSVSSHRRGSRKGDADMTHVLVWKVYREQRVVWLAMAALAVGVLILDRTLLGPMPEQRYLATLMCMIAYAYGLVVGAMLLAGEREEGTAFFLETLPAEQLAIWRIKGAAGAMLVLTQVLFLWLIVVANEWGYRKPGSAALLFGALASAAGLGFAWGLFCSGWTRTALGAILAAVLIQAVVAPVLFFLWELVRQVLDMPPRQSPGGEVGAVFGFGTLLVLGLLVASGSRQARLDRLRRPEASPSRVETRARGGWLSQLAALLWLVWRQSRSLYGGLAVVALIAGLFLPLWVLAWPLLTLLLGVTAGLAVFAGEQTERTGRFLTEQRLSPTLVWACKVGTHLVLAVSVASLLLLPAAARVAIEKKNASSFTPSSDFALLAPYLQLSPYLSLWLGYAFSVGCLCGLLFRKLVVSSFIACGASLLLALLWAPSLLVGGLHAWQIWGPPLLLLLTVRLLLWPWATGRLGSRRALVYLAGGLTLAGLWLAGALAYRVIEVPLVEDVLTGFERTVEAERKNEASRLIPALLRQVPDWNVAIEPARERPPGGMPGEPTGPIQVWQQITEVVRKGWPAKEAALGVWLDEAFRQPWAGKLAEAVQLPLGVVEDVPSMTFLTPLPRTFHAAEAVELLVARGLQLQARGNPAAFVDNLETDLALVRQLYHREPGLFVKHAESTERMLLQGVERWLERLGKRPDLLRRVLSLLVEHDQEIEKGSNDHLLADYLVMRNSLAQPERLVGRVFRLQRHHDKLLAALVALAWGTPWEQARLQRLIRLAADQQGVSFPLPKLLLAGQNPWAEPFRHKRWENIRETRLRAHELIVALRLNQTETGQPARTLQELTPKILATLPVDPATRMPFGYRLSDGEELPQQGPGQIPCKVPPGQGILTSKEETYLVPLPPRP